MEDVDDELDRFVAVSGRRLLRTARLLAGERHAAEDLYQTTLLKVWTSWSSITSDPEAYARRVMLHAYVSGRRRRWHGELPTADLPDRPDHSAGGSDLDLRAALARLPRRQRAVLVLRYYEDQTETATAAAMGVTVGTVKSQTAKALRRLGVDGALRPQTAEELA